MFPLTATAYIELIRIDLALSRDALAGIYARVRRMPVGMADGEQRTVEMICLAVDRASVWYWKQVSCLQRSAATTCLLRRTGIPAQLVIGVQTVPFRAHAWVEVEGIIVNDKPYISDLYAVLDRC